MGKTPEFHPDHRPLTEAVERIEEIGHHVNEAKVCATDGVHVQVFESVVAGSRVLALQ